MKKSIKKWAAPLLCGLFTFLMLNFVLFVGCVSSASMEPTIKTGSYIFGHRIIGDIHRGDVMVFRHEEHILVKRIAAVPGDMVYIDDIKLTLSVNEELPDSTRILTVPESCYFMLGDNTENSVDSCSWTDPFITREQIIAVVWRR